MGYIVPGVSKSGTRLSDYAVKAGSSQPTGPPWPPWASSVTPVVCLWIGL